MTKPEKCNCEQSLAAEQTIKDLNGEIILRDARIRVLQATAREGMRRIDKIFRLEKLFERTIEDCKRVSYKDVGHKCESRKVVEKISQRFTDYQKERGGE